MFGPFVFLSTVINGLPLTCSCVSIRTAKGIHVLEIDGQRTVPSIVAFTDKDYLVGKAAKSQVICSYKTLLNFGLLDRQLCWEILHFRVD